MTQERMEAAIENSSLWQEAQKKHWQRCGFASYAAGLAVCAAGLLKVALTGNDPRPTMIFTMLTFVFIGIAFATAGRQRAAARRR